MREAAKSKDTPGFMINIPFTVKNSSESEIKIDARVSRNDLAVPALRCEVFDQSDGTLVFSRDVLSTDFGSANILEKISVGVAPNLEPTHQYNMRIYFTGNVNVAIETVCLLQ